MWTVANHSNPKARKDHDCNACDFINSTGCEVGDLSQIDLAIWKNAESEGFKILKGSQYIKVKGIYDGEPATFKARIDVNDLCVRNGWYDD